jgi:hypothetical protein
MSPFFGSVHSKPQACLYWLRGAWNPKRNSRSRINRRGGTRESSASPLNLSARSLSVAHTAHRTIPLPPNPSSGRSQLSVTCTPSCSFAFGVLFCPDYLVLSAPALLEVEASGRVSDVFDSPEHCEDYRDMYDMRTKEDIRQKPVEVRRPRRRSPDHLLVPWVNVCPTTLQYW